MYTSCVNCKLQWYLHVMFKYSILNRCSSNYNRIIPRFSKTLIFLFHNIIYIVILDRKYVRVYLYMAWAFSTVAVVNTDCDFRKILPRMDI